ncbi:MAG: DUF349 domain-containing protein, partial [Gammaproteobacteria bacterium]|nr:DUF349 domain-containing protein [Gammaproteobacteria bacterium]
MFSKPKWQHRDADVRKQAVTALRPELAADAEVLLQLAKTDTDNEVRTLATRRLSDLATLAGLMQPVENPPPVVEVATQRWLKFIVQGDADLTARMAQVAALSDLKLLEHIARNANASPLRLSALQKTEKESLATDLAINDADPAIRAAALAKVTQVSALERIIKAARTKDKLTYHTAKAKLETALEAIEKPKRIQEHADKLIAQIEQVPHNGNFEFQVARFEELLTVWNALQPDVTDATRARCEAAQQHTRDHLDTQKQLRDQQAAAEAAWIPGRTARQQLLDRAAQLHADLSARLQLDAELPAAIEAALTEIATQWQSTAELPADEHRDYEARLTRALRAVRDELATLQQTAQIGAAYQDWISQARALLQAAALDITRYQRLQRSVAKNRETPARFSALWSELTQLMSALDERANQQAIMQKQAQKAFEQHLKSLEKALEEGHLDDATRAHREAQKALRIAHEVAAAARRAWHELEERFVKMRDWRNWANTPQKERLIAQMEALIGSTEDPIEIGNQVRAAREEWQRLGGGATDAETSEALWQRFNQACDQAYAPAKQHFEAQSQQRAHSAEAREAFLIKLEEFISAADWATVDWNKVERLSREARVEWRNLGITDRKVRKTLDERFDAAIATLKEKLSAEWTRNVQQKEALIARITALHANADEQAIRSTKQAGAQWKAIGPVGHRKEQALWKAFRAACDGVFNRNREQADLSRQAREQQRAQKIALIEQIERINALATEELLAAHGAFKDLETQWPTLAGDEKLDADLQRRYDTAIHAHQAARVAARTA